MFLDPEICKQTCYACCRLYLKSINQNQNREPTNKYVENAVNFKYELEAVKQAVETSCKWVPSPDYSQCLFILVGTHKDVSRTIESGRGKEGTGLVTREGQ